MDGSSDMYQYCTSNQGSKRKKVRVLLFRLRRGRNNRGGRPTVSAFFVQQLSALESSLRNEKVLRALSTYRYQDVYKFWE